MSRPHIRIGIDVGGTFTDFVIADMRNGELAYHKEPSVPADPSAAVERGIAAVIHMGVLPVSVSPIYTVDL